MSRRNTRSRSRSRRGYPICNSNGNGNGGGNDNGNDNGSETVIKGSEADDPSSSSSSPSSSSWSSSSSLLPLADSVSSSSSEGVTVKTKVKMKRNPPRRVSSLGKKRKESHDASRAPSTSHSNDSIDSSSSSHSASDRNEMEVSSSSSSSPSLSLVSTLSGSPTATSTSTSTSPTMRYSVRRKKPKMNTGRRSGRATAKDEEDETNEETGSVDAELSIDPNDAENVLPPQPLKKRANPSELHPLPADFEQVLFSTRAAKAAWEDITPLARNEWICWVTMAKKEDTRSRRIERARNDLIAGKRRPCCWPGCPHRRPSAKKYF